jgi:hypothetical protein
MRVTENRVVEINPDAETDCLRFWVGYPTNEALDDLACQRVETIVADTIASTKAFDEYEIEVRPEYVLAVVSGVGVSTAPQRVTDELGRIVSAYNTRHIDRPDNDVVELDIRRRHVGTLGIQGADVDLDEAREFLRERGASPSDGVTAEAADDVATAEAGGEDG